MDIARWFSELLHQPLRMLLVSVGVCTALLLYDGSFWKWWSLQRNYKEMSRRISSVATETRHLRFQLEEATKMSFVERQATEHLGLVREDDLVFVFTNDEP